MNDAGDGDRSAPDEAKSLRVLIHYLASAGAKQPNRAAGALLREFGSVGRILSGSLARLTRVVGPRTAALIRASHKLVQSSLLEQVKSGPVLADRLEVLRYLQLQLGSLRHERVLAIYVDRNLRLVHSARIAEGSAGRSEADIPRIVHIALDVGAAGIVVVHNHPSGDPTPSRSDLAWTARLSRVAADLELRLIDHIIIAEGQFRSLMEST